MSRFNSHDFKNVPGWNGDLHELTLLNGSRILFWGIEDPTQRIEDRLNKLHSLELDWFAIEQGEEISKDTYSALRASLRGGNGPRKGWMALNPAGGGWIRQIAKTANHETFHFETAKNRYLPSDYIEELRETYRGRMADAYLFGRWVELTGLVWPEFDMNCVSAILPDGNLPILRSWDFGFEHPAITFHQFDQKRHVWRILGELEGLEQGIGAFKTEVDDYVGAHFEGHEWFSDVGDPYHGPQHGDKSAYSTVELLQSMGVYVKQKREGIRSRVERVRNGFSDYNVYVHPRCRRVIEAITENYVWDSRLGVPHKDKDYEHLMDTIQYAASWEIKPKREPKAPLEPKYVYDADKGIEAGSMISKYVDRLSEYHRRIEGGDIGVSMPAFDWERLHEGS